MTTAIFEYASYARSRLSYAMSTTNTEIEESKSVKQLIAASTVLYSALSALSRIKEFKTPKLIVVGTQSSGKSSLLNALMGFHLLPTGDTMTTRSAIQVQLINYDGSAYVEFGNYNNGEWTVDKTITLHNPPTVEEQAGIQATISAETIKLLNGSKGVLTSMAISMRLYSNAVPNMSFVDLPGITMTALTSEGQPIDMCNQIRKLIQSFVDERTIVLMVCAARSDLEADAAVALCMSMTGGKRTIGCLTKVDLCDCHEGVSAYLKDKYSSDLKIEYGYFAVKCKTSANENISNVYASEDSFFKQNFKDCEKRVGVLKLANTLNCIVCTHISRCLPDLKKELIDIRDSASFAYSTKLCYTIPISNADKLTFVHDLMSKYCHHLEGIITSRKPDTSTGRIIRESFAVLRDDVRKLCAFDTISDSEITIAVQNCEGWSMITPVPPVEIVEFFMQHEVHRPIQKLLYPCVNCIDNVHRHIQEECVKLAETTVPRFKHLILWIIDNIKQTLSKERSETIEILQKLLNIEEAYIFTDNPAFVKEWTSASQKSTASNYCSVLRSILSSYFTVVVESIASQVPKLIVHNVRKMLNNLHGQMYQSLHELQDVSHLLFESEEVESLRESLTNTICITNNCLRAIDDVLTDIN